MTIESQKLLDGLGTNVFVTDLDWQIIHVNPHARESLQGMAGELFDSLGLDVDGVIGLNLAEFDEDPQARLAAIESVTEFPFVAAFRFGEMRIRATIGQVEEFLQSDARLVTWDDVSELHRMREELAHVAGQAEAIRKSQAIIEFEMDGTIITANSTFLDVMGYNLDQIAGRHHRIFVDSVTAESDAYKNFWKRLGRGEFETGEYKRIANGGREVWLQSSYNPILDASGNPFKVMKFASDVTEQKERSADFAGQIGAIGKSLAVLHFEMDGTIITANQLFLDAMEYTLDEIVGQQHSMFVGEEMKNSEEYADSWDQLRQGRFISGRFKRFSGSGNEVWLQSSYNPILDLNGKPVKVVKYAFEVTDQVAVRNQMAHVLDTVSVNSRTLAVASAELTVASEQMGENSNSTSEEADILASAAKQVSGNVGVVASGIEALTESIGLIATNASEGASVAQRAVEVANITNETISKLSQSSAEIGNVVSVIKSIASQTNLLALNASIEAARAGEAGRGFAVVAEEVKTLATATKKATVDITDKVDAIQKDTEAAIHEIDEIGKIIKDINEIQRSISDAVHEQRDTTGQMSSGISEAATGSSEIAYSIAGVAAAAKVASVGAHETHEAAAELGRMAADLEALTGTS